jgi:cell wall-associated NlpC family hydrolase
MKMNFGYTLNERTAAGMAGAAKPRITRAKLVPGDLIFFGPNGPKSTAASIYHAALYLGNGWFIQSTGSLDGVGLSSLNSDSYWKSAFAWGRRVLKKGQFAPLTSVAPAQ